MREGQPSLQRTAVIAALIFSIWGSPAQAYFPGDLNDDCQLDAADALLLGRHLSGASPIPGLESSGNADLAPLNGSGQIDPDGSTDIADLLVMLRILRGDVETPDGATVIADPGTTQTPSNPIALSGAGPNGATIHIYVNGAEIYPSPITSGTAWNGNVALVDGLNTIQARAELDGELGCLSPAVEISYFNTIERDPSGEIVIEEDTVWTPGDGTPYRIDEGLLVNPGVVFTVQPGTTIEISSEFTGGDDSVLSVEGTLRMVGTPTDPITVTAIDPPGPGESIEAQWSRIEIGPSSSDSVIQHATIEFGKDCVEVIGASLVLSDSSLRNCDSYALLMTAGAFGSILDNHFYWDLGELGDIGLGLHDSTVQLDGNTIERFGSYAVEVHGDETATFSFTNNTIRDNHAGVYLSGSPTISGFSGNDLVANDEFNLDAGALPDTHRIDVSGNWWGSDDPVVISQSIDDISFFGGGGFADFVPFLDDSISALPPGSETHLSETSLPPGTRYGVLEADEVVAAGSDFGVLHTLIVPEGRELTILEGSTLRFYPDASFFVAGSLESLGISSDPSEAVLVRSTDSVAGRGLWTGMVIAATSPSSILEHTSIESTVFGIGTSSPSFSFNEGSIAHFLSAGIFLSGTGTVSNVEIDNTVGSPVGFGILVGAGATAEITDTMISGTQTGIFVTGSSTVAEISGSTISGAQTGIRLTAVPGENLILFGNKLVSISQDHLRTSGYGNRTVIDAEYNYWDTLEPAEISARIVDRADSLTNQAIVDFIPFRDENDQVVSPPGSLVGLFTADESLTSSGGPYEVVGYLGTQPGTTLTVHPGSEVRFTPGALLEIDGTLSVPGTASSRPRFTSAGSPTRGAWEGIVVRAPGGATIEHTDIEYATVGIDVLDGASATLVDLEIRDFSEIGARFGSGSTGSIEASTVRSNLSAFVSGIELLSAGMVAVTANEITDVGTGITVRGGTPGPVSQNQIRRTMSPADGIGIWIEDASPDLVANGIDGFEGGILLDNSWSSVSQNVVQNATGDTAQAIDIWGGAPEVSDSQLLDNSVGIKLRFGTTALVTDNFIDQPNQAETGTGIEVVGPDVTSVIELNTIQGFQVGIDVDDPSSTSAPSIDQNVLSSNVTGVRLDQAPATTVVSGNAIDGVAPMAPGDIGISLLHSSAWITAANQITNHRVGIRVLGGSAPVIDAGNTIHANEIGILLEGTGAAGGNPHPTIQGNNLFDNTDPVDGPTNLRLESFHAPSGAVIDATGNWWGSTVASTIASSIVDKHQEHTIPVDYSEYLGAQDGQTVGGSGLVTALLTGVFVDPVRFNPVLDAPARIHFSLSKAATVTVEIYPESIDERSDPVWEDSQGFGPGAAHWLEWDGRTSPPESALLSDDAYVYVVSATDGSLLETYDPSRPSGGGDGSGDSPSQELNAFRNEFWTMDYSLNSGPGRVTMRVSPQNNQFPAFIAFEGIPFLPGLTPVHYDGRMQDGSLLSNTIGDGSFVTEPYILDFDAPNHLKPNFIIVSGTDPRISGSHPTAGPTVEVKSDPYLVYHSYDQVSRIAYCVDRDSIVTVKILKPGGLDPDNPSHVADTLQDQVVMSAVACDQGAEPHELVWHGSATSDSNEMRSSEDGVYTFTIEAEDVSEGRQSLYRGVVQVRQ